MQEGCHVSVEAVLIPSALSRSEIAPEHRSFPLCAEREPFRGDVAESGLPPEAGVNLTERLGCPRHL